MVIFQAKIKCEKLVLFLVLYSNELNVLDCWSNKTFNIDIVMDISHCFLMFRPNKLSINQENNNADEMIMNIMVNNLLLCPALI